MLYQIGQNEKIIFEGQGALLEGVIDVDNKLEDLSIEFDKSYIKGSIVKKGSNQIYYPDNFFIGVDKLSYRITDQLGYSKYLAINIRILPNGNVKSFDHIVLYPNPSKGIFYFNDLIVDNILIFDFFGNNINNYNYVQNGLKLQVNGSALPKGQYIVYLFYKSTVIAIKKIILI